MLLSFNRVKNEKVIEQQREQVFYRDLDEKTNYRYVQST